MTALSLVDCKSGNPESSECAFRVLVATSVRDVGADDQVGQFHGSRDQYLEGTLEYLLRNEAAQSSYEIVGVVVDDISDYDETGDYSIMPRDSQWICDRRYLKSSESFVRNVPSSFRRLPLSSRSERAELKCQFERELKRIFVETRADVLLLDHLMLRLEWLHHWVTVINIHPGVTDPRSPYCRRGCHVTQETIDAAASQGETRTGATLHFVNDLLDDGEVIESTDQVRIPRGLDKHQVRQKVYEEAKNPIVMKGLRTLASRRYDQGARQFVNHTSNFRSIANDIHTQLLSNSDQIAFVVGDRRYSYRDLSLDIARVSAVLRADFEKDGLFALVLPRSYEFAVFALTLFLNGQPFVAIDPVFSEEVRRRLLRRLSPDRVILEIDSRFMLDPAGAFAELDLPAVDFLNPSQTALVLLTSGSTGDPQGVPRTHGCLADTRDQAMKIMAYRDELQCVAVMRAPVGSSGIVWELFYPMAAGAKVVIASASEARSPELLAKLIRFHEVRFLGANPSTIEGLLATDDFRESHSLERVDSSGSTLPSEVAKALVRCFPKAASYTYGCTEAPGITRRSLLEGSLDDLSEIGKVNPSYRYRILDEGGSQVPVGEAGVLAVSGPRVAPAYWKNPSLSAKRFRFLDDGQQYFLTGDLVSEMPSGSLRLVGRADRVVQVRSYRVNLAGVERTIFTETGYRSAVVMIEGKLLVVLEAPRDEMLTLREKLHTTLPHHSRPGRLAQMEKLPETVSGKVSYASFTVLPMKRPSWDREPTEPLDQIEDGMVEIWEEVLGIAPIGRDDDFFLLGGDSLSVIDLQCRCEKALGVRLHYEAVYQYSRLQDLASFVRGNSRNNKRQGWSCENLDASGSPVLFVSGGFSESECLSILGANHPRYYLPYLGFDQFGRRVRHERLEDIVAELSQFVLERTDAQSFIIVSFCRWSLLSVELAHQLEAQGKKVEKLVIYEPSKRLGRLTIPEVGAPNAPVLAESRSVASVWSKHFGALRSLSWRQRAHYICDKAMFLDRIKSLAARLEVRFADRLNLPIRARSLDSFFENVVFFAPFRNYRFKPLTVPVIVVCCEESHFYVPHEWAGLSCGPIKIMTVKGAGHVDGLRSPFLDQWAKEIFNEPE